MFELRAYGLTSLYEAKSWYNWQHYSKYNDIWKTEGPRLCGLNMSTPTSYSEGKKQLEPLFVFKILDVEKLSKYRTELCLGRRERLTKLDPPDKNRLMGGRLPDCLHNCVPGGPQAVWADKLYQIIS